MMHAYISSDKFNEGKELVKVSGSFLNFTANNTVAIDFLVAGLVLIPIDQLEAEIELDAETRICTLKIPRWLADDKRIKYDHF